jgi:hypothetical protein
LEQSKKEKERNPTYVSKILSNLKKTSKEKMMEEYEKQTKIHSNLV